MPAQYPKSTKLSEVNLINNSNYNSNWTGGVNSHTDSMGLIQYLGESQSPNMNHSQTLTADQGTINMKASNPKAQRIVSNFASVSHQMVSSSQPATEISHQATGGLKKQKIQLEQLQSTKLSSNNDSFEANLLNHSMNTQQMKKCNNLKSRYGRS